MRLPEGSEHIRQALRQISSIKATAGVIDRAPYATNAALNRVSRYLSRLDKLTEEGDAPDVSIDDLRYLGMPVAAVERAIAILKSPSVSVPPFVTAIAEKTVRAETQMLKTTGPIGGQMPTNTTPQTTDFTRDVLGRYVCNGLDEALRSTDPTVMRQDGRGQIEARDFDVIVVGGGNAAF